eukprot:gene9067-1627_t
MAKRLLGKGGPRVSPVGLGCMGMTAFYKDQATPGECRATLEAALASGCTVWDTAQVCLGPRGEHLSNYSCGETLRRVAPGCWMQPRTHRSNTTCTARLGVSVLIHHHSTLRFYFGNEEFLQPTLAKSRGQVFLCTKMGLSTRRGRVTLDSSPQQVKLSAETSLRRLGTDHIDLYYQHRVDPQVPIEHTVEAMSSLVREGKVKYLGLSEAGPGTIRRAHSVEYSPWALEIETNGVLDTCRELGIAVVAYSPLGRGFLSCKFSSAAEIPQGDYRQGAERFTEPNFTKNMGLASYIKTMSEGKGCTPAQLCLAWLLHQGPDIIPIPGTTRRKNLAENIAATDIKLSEGEMSSIRDKVAHYEVAGSRYADAMMESCFTEAPLP